MRPYDELARTVAAAVPADADRTTRMQCVVDVLWPALSPTGVSWLGFYTERPEAPESERLELGPREPRPACSPIGLHGVCGQSFVGRIDRVVHDVAELGPDYIACDPRDRSEVVVPCLDADGRCWGVLDLDSFDVGAFDRTDAGGLVSVLRAAGLVADSPAG